MLSKVQHEGMTFNKSFSKNKKEFQVGGWADESTQQSNDHLLIVLCNYENKFLTPSILPSFKLHLSS